MPRAELIDDYRQADVLFLLLHAVPALDNVLPSKFFEYAALGKPILAGLGSYAARVIRDELDNAPVFPPRVMLRLAPRPRAPDCSSGIGDERHW